MIYLFGKPLVEVIMYDGSLLTEKDKTGSVVVNELPKKEEKEGYDAVLFLDEKNNPYWEYKPIAKPTLEELVKKEILSKEQYKTLTGKDYLEQ
jgi:hypothetical protein